VIDHLGDRATLTIDARGWSRSRALPGPYTLEQLARDVIVEAGLIDYVVVGHSMGGKVAQLFASPRPAGLAGLVLVGSGPAKPAAEITPEYQQQLSHAYDSAEMVAFARDNVLTATPLPDDVKARIVADSLDVTPEARASWPLCGIAQDITDDTRKLQVLTIVVGGENDQVEPVQVLRDNLLPYLPQAQFTVIHNTGHLMPLEAAEPLAQSITAFSPER
jgi:pimeloyl-ACP methyl ester carboxylesterase